MADLSGNSCNIITILPLGIDCDVINASTPDASNGYMAILITGGTPPYNVSWNNGGQGTYLTNLSPGNYTATVVDYYGDFTATTTCTVGYESFYLEVFEDCSNSGSYIYYLASIPSLFITNKTYKLTTQTGCWDSVGTTLYTGQTYYDYVAVSSAGPYNTCIQCQPPIPATVIYNGPLCLSKFTHPFNYSQTTYYSGNTINNYPSWTSSTQTIYYNTGTTRWTVSGWTSSNVPYLQNPNTPPIGSWTYPGAFLSSVDVVTGVCTSPALNITVNAQMPSCSTSNGSATINVTGGVPPYQYSLNNIVYSYNSVYPNLPPGLKTIFVKDSATPQNTASQTFNIIPTQNYTNYLLNLTFNQQGPLTNNPQQTASSYTYDKNTYFNITLTPNTPFNSPSTVKFDLTFDISTTAYTNATDIPVIMDTVNVTGSSATTVTSPTSSIPVIQTTSRPSCAGGNIVITTYRISYLNCLIQNVSANIGGLINQHVFEPCSTDSLCTLRAYSDITLTIKKISINPLNCQGIDTTVISNTTGVQKFGPICPPSS